MSVDICSVCNLPKDLCVCKAIEREGAVHRIKISRTKAKFNKYVTVVDGIEKSQIKEIYKALKRKLACGGAIKDGSIVLQGDHKKKVKDILIALGYKKDIIEEVD
ncbi:MAG: stress response translation initiation inhibitor YciH [Methanobacteriota archaeon]|nr:MAG: stress response translation initiation inhibitor YciH [Euryarchaeota archaeon]